MLTGFDMTEFPGELGMQAFNAAQTRRPFSIALVGLGMLRIVLQPDELPRTLQQVAKGFAMGFAAKSLLAVRFEEDLAKPLETWRRELNLVDGVSLRASSGPRGAIMTRERACGGRESATRRARRSPPFGHRT